MRSAFRYPERFSGIYVLRHYSADVNDRLLLMYGESRVFEYHNVIAERGRSAAYRIRPGVNAVTFLESERHSEYGDVFLVSHRIAFRHFPRKYGRSFAVVSLLRVVNNYFDFARRNFVNDFGRIHHAHVVIRSLVDYTIDIVSAYVRSVAALAGERDTYIVRRFVPSEPALFGLDFAQFELKLPGIAVFDRNGRNGYPHGALGHRVVRYRSALEYHGIVPVGACRHHRVGIGFSRIITARNVSFRQFSDEFDFESRFGKFLAGLDSYKRGTGFQFQVRIRRRRNQSFSVDRYESGFIEYNRDLARRDYELRKEIAPHVVVALPAVDRNGICCRVLACHARYALDIDSGHRVVFGKSHTGLRSRGIYGNRAYGVIPVGIGVAVRLEEIFVGKLYVHHAFFYTERRGIRAEDIICIFYTQYKVVNVYRIIRVRYSESYPEIVRSEYLSFGYYIIFAFFCRRNGYGLIVNGGLRIYGDNHGSALYRQFRRTRLGKIIRVIDRAACFLSRKIECKRSSHVPTGVINVVASVTHRRGKTCGQRSRISYLVRFPVIGLGKVFERNTFEIVICFIKGEDLLSRTVVVSARRSRNYEFKAYVFI